MAVVFGWEVGGRLDTGKPGVWGWRRVGYASRRAAHHSGNPGGAKTVRSDGHDDWLDASEASR